MKFSGQLRTRLSTAIVAGAVALGGVVLAAPSAVAAGPSYCASSTCSLASGPYSSNIYFEMPRGTALSMKCWTDTQWYNGTNRWFKVAGIYGTGYTSANSVGGQTSVGHC